MYKHVIQAAKELTAVNMYARVNLTWQRLFYGKLGLHAVQITW